MDSRIAWATWWDPVSIKSWLYVKLTDYNRSIGRCVALYSWLKCYHSNSQRLSLLFRLESSDSCFSHQVHSSTQQLLAVYLLWARQLWKTTQRRETTKHLILLTFPRPKIFTDHSSQILKTIFAKAKVKDPHCQSLIMRRSPGQGQRSVRKTNPHFPNIQVHHFQQEGGWHKRHWASLWQTHDCCDFPRGAVYHFPVWGPPPLSLLLLFSERLLFIYWPLCPKLQTYFHLASSYFSCIILTGVFHVLKLFPFHNNYRIIIM